MTSETETEAGAEAEAEAEAEAPRRPHPAAITVEAARSTMQLVIGAIVIAVARGGTPGTATALALAGIAAGAAAGWIRWRATTYRLDDVALRFRSGVFTPDEKIVPRARVQAVDTTTGPLQRLFGVVELRVQVPGASAEDEIVLAAVTHAEAARLRRELGQPEPEAPDERVRLGLGELLAAGLTGPQIGVVASAVAGVYAIVDNVVDIGVAERLLAQVDSVRTALLAAGILLAIAYVLSAVAAVLVFAGFQVERDGQVLRIRRGLLSRRVLSIPLARVDGVVIVEGLARGPLGLAALRLESVAHGGERTAARTLLPIVRRRDAEAVVARLVPRLAITPGALERPPPRALRRFVLRPALLGAAAGGAAALAPAALWPAAPAPAALWTAAPVLAAVGAIMGVRAYRAAGVRLAGDVVVVREARIARRTLLARRHRLQEHALERSVLQVRASLADLRVTVGSGGTGRARHLDAAAAAAAFAALRRS